VDDSLPVAAVEANPSVRIRFQSLHALMHALSVGRGPASRVTKRAIKALTSRRLRRWALRVTRRRVVYGETRPPDEGLMLELRWRFKGEVVALSEYLDRDLVSLWGYDSIG
jgi:hypothetical protein